MKKMFTLEKLKQMDKWSNELKNMSYKLEIMKLENENKPVRSELDSIAD